MLSGNCDEMRFAFYGLVVSGRVGWLGEWEFLLCKLHLLQSADHRWYKSRGFDILAFLYVPTHLAVYSFMKKGVSFPGGDWVRYQISRFPEYEQLPSLH
jgi:hypothetical protein